MNESASVTSSSLAIAEKRPRRTGGCVGIFFQLFDWNRRFAKKKLFSKRLLPPDRAKDASKKFGGDEKQPKLRLIADENSGGFPNTNKNGVSSVNCSVGKNGVQTPSLVARLMGLESMPSVQRKKLQKDSSGEFRVGRREKVAGDSDEFEKETTRQEFRPQKLQKTGMIERRTVTRFGAEALQLKNVLSRSRKHHHPSKLSSPVKNTAHHPRRNTSRLIGAATRILEPGLQSRSKSKYAITYAHSSRRPPENELRPEPIKGENLDSSGSFTQAACKNCGNLFNIAESISKRDNHTSAINSVQVSPNGNSKYNSPSFNQEQELSAYFKENIRRQKKQFTHIRKQGESSSNRPRMASNAATSTGKQMKPNPCSVDRIFIEKQSDYQGQSSKFGGNKNRDGIAFRFSSPTKNRSEIPIKAEKRRNPCRKPSLNQSNEKISLQKPFPLTGDSLGALLQEKLKEFTSNSSTNIFQELICPINMKRPSSQNDMEFSPQRNRLPHNTSFRLKTKPEKPGALFGHKNIDHLSPGSVLAASFSNESCCSSSLEDSSVQGHTQHVDSTSYSYDESQFLDSVTDPFYSGAVLVADLLAYISEVLRRVDLFNARIKGNARAYAKEVIFNTELVLGNPNKIDSFFVCRFLLDLDAISKVMWTRFGNFLGSNNTNTGYQLKRFVFDCLIEYLDLKYGQYSKCGFRAWMNRPTFMGPEILIREVFEKVRRWTGFVGVTADELVEKDMGRSFGKWTDFEIESYETGAKIEGDILQMLVDELMVDLTN